MTKTQKNLIVQIKAFLAEDCSIFCFREGF